MTFPDLRVFLDTLRRRNDVVEVAAPVDARLEAAEIHRRVIAAGDPIMLIVPASDNLMVEVKVDPKDIDQVQFGQPVLSRFTSFNVRTTP